MDCEYECQFACQKDRSSSAALEMKHRMGATTASVHRDIQFSVKEWVYVKAGHTY